MAKMSAIEMLSKLNMSNDLVNLRTYYNTPSFLEIIGKERLEEVHSNILAWFFNDPEIRKSEIIFRFLNLILFWAEKESIKINDDFKKSIYTNSILIEENYDVIREERIITPSYGIGRIDIVIKCKCKYNNIQKKLNIIIENKVNASETKKDKDRKIMKQTQAYYDHYSSNQQEDINIFVFLKPGTTYELYQQISNNKIQEIRECKDFVVINYQELLSNIMEPILKIGSISEKTTVLLRDYIKSLGKTKKNDIMCYSEEEKKLLLTFYKNNEDLFEAVMTVLEDDPETPDEIKEKAKVFRTAQSNQKKMYLVSWTDSNGTLHSENVTMAKFAKEFALYLLDKENSNTPSIIADNINKIFKELVGRDEFYISDNKDDAAKKHYIEIKDSFDNSYYLQQDWRGSGGSRDNFTSLLKSIKKSKMYRDFIIEEL